MPQPSFDNGKNTVGLAPLARTFTRLESLGAEGPLRPLTTVRYFRYIRSMWRRSEIDVTRYADILAAMGTEPRLRIMRLLLSAHPGGMVVGDIHESLGIAGSTLSHHLDKLRNEDLVRVRRDGTFLWYSANTETLRELLTFLCTECCSSNQVIEFKSILTHARKG